VSPNGQLFAARAGRTRVGIFRTDGGRQESAFDVSTGGDIGALAWSRAGSLAVSGNEGRVQLWDVSGRPHLARALHGMGSIDKLPEAVTALAFSPDGSLVAAGDVNHTPGAVQWRYGTVAVWNVATGRLLWRVRNKDGWVNDVAFSTDGTMLAAAQETNRVTLYDPHTGQALRAVHPEGLTGYVSVAFSPGGLLATGVWSGIVQLWDPSSGREVGKPTPVAPAPVSSISFNPSGSTFATTGGSDGLAKLWTTETLQPVGSALAGARGTWSHAAYTPDGHRLVVVYDDGTGSVWPTSVGAWERRACAVAGRNLTQAEWRQYVGGSAYRATCPGQPGVSGT
jgi:WD40 repeat protein